MELPAEVPTLDGHTIKIDKTTDGDVLVAGNKVVMPDIEASNGVIHVIDGVASPKVPLIGQNGGYVAGTEPGSGEGRTGLDTKVSSGGGGGGW